ncbi:MULTISPECIES: hypothetical protein [unclassified Corallococcus]|uniref:hypothetical protein n=1 Tax=unclassified Corallococcus TaxID=2685029 RepID=UPI001A8D041B|nr:MULTISPECIES: hypothetical protein [unclassified Corallococcus]MBN9682343.1 hypothetical protein [Corallococcus sp. NCSPR001]WAS86104.1 hypothetical protein O0N60_03815 [Corallococcus sp. NCRR]
MTGFKRAVGLGLLVGGALGGWGCGKESPPDETRGFQDPVQLQHRSRAEPAGESAGSPLRDTSSEEGGGKPYNSDSRGSLGGGTAAPNRLEGNTGAGQRVGGSGELGTGLAESYRSAAPSQGTGGSGLDAGTGGSGGMDAGTGGSGRDAGMEMMDAGTRR